MKKKALLLLSLPFMLLGCSNQEAPAGKQIVSNLHAQDLYGEEYNQSLFAGKITVLNLWADWCGPCLSELDLLNELHVTYSAEYNFQFVGVCTSNTNLDKAKQIYEEHNLQYISLTYNSSLRTFSNMTSSIPFSVFIDGNGRQIGTSITGTITKSKWERRIRQALGL